MKSNNKKLLEKWTSNPNTGKEIVQDTGNMPRFARDKYPLGSYPGQKLPGIPMNPEGYKTLKIYSKSVLKDLTLTMTCVGDSGALVGAGKSLLMQQYASCYVELLNDNLRKLGRHDEQINFSMDNIVFGFDEGKKRAFELKRYSPLIFDESNELRGNALSKKMQEVGEFFDKNRQLNLFIIIIAPNLFKIPSELAVDRSNLLVVVKFRHNKESGEFFKRGYYDIYNQKDKRILFYKGKKNFRDMNCHKPTFKNCYFYGKCGYEVDEKEYLKAKREDTEGILKRDEPKKDKNTTRKDILTPIILDKLSKGESVKSICESTLINKQTFYNWGFTKYSSPNSLSRIYYNNTPVDRLKDGSAWQSEEES